MAYNKPMSRHYVLHRFNVSTKIGSGGIGAMPPGSPCGWGGGGHTPPPNEKDGSTGFGGLSDMAGANGSRRLPDVEKTIL